MAATAIRRKHPDAFKRKVVKYALRVGNASEAADRYDIWESLIRRWARDPEFGGVPSAFVRPMKGKKPKSNGTNSVGLPVNVASKRPKGIRDAVPVLFACPHCGGRIRIGGDL